MLSQPNLEIELFYYSTVFFIVTISMYTFLTPLITLLRNSNNFLKNHFGLARTIGIFIIIGLSKILSTYMKTFLEEITNTEIDYDQSDVINSYFIGKTIAILILVFQIIYSGK